MTEPRRWVEVDVEAAPSITTELFSEDEFVAVLFDSRDGARHQLNSAATAVWTTLDGSTSVLAMVGELVELGVAASEAASLVDDVLSQFWDLGVLRGSPAPLFGRSPKIDTAEGQRLPREPDP